MVGPRLRSVRLPAGPAAADWLLALLGPLLLASMTLLTPAFTDYEVEAEPAIQAFLAGDLSAGVHALPVYGGSVLAALPFAALAKLLGGGDLAVFRAVALPGALGVAWLAALAGRWLRDGGATRGLQLLGVGLIALSPALSLAWNYGHPEEPLVAAVAVAGVVAATRTGRHAPLIAGALIGLACAGKLWAVVLGPVALAAMPDRRAALRFLVAGAGAGGLLLAPTLVGAADHIQGTALGYSRIFTEGNLWWFLGTPNPAYVEHATTVTSFTTDNSARLGPAWVELHARQLIVAVAVILSAAWWWLTTHRPPMGVQQRGTQILLLAAAVVWWRALMDPWFQPYYLASALFALVLADARSARLPAAGAVAWCALWLMYGQNAPDMGFSADVKSALGLAWLVPMGIYLSVRALRPVR